MSESSLQEKCLTTLREWYDSYRPSPGTEPKQYIINVGLSTLEKMRGKFPLEHADYVSPGNRLRSTGARIRKILESHGENRNWLTEGARTTSSSVPAAKILVSRLNGFEEIGSLPTAEREELISTLQAWLAVKATEYLDRKGILVEIRLDRPAPLIVRDILSAAQKGQRGAVAQHLVGAKLALRYPHLEIDNYSSTTADVQLGRRGDFQLNDTIFHVTLAPAIGVVEKCATNLRNGFRAILIVPNSQVAAAISMTEQAEMKDKFGIQAIESFIGQNIEEIGEFGKSNIAASFRLLIEKYNERVVIERDPSLLIEMPENL